MDKNELLNKIRNTYFYQYRKMDTEQELTTFQNRSKYLTNQISRIDTQISNVEVLQNNLRKVVVSPQIKSAKVNLDKKKFYIISIIVALVLSILISAVTKYIGYQIAYVKSGYRIGADAYNFPGWITFLIWVACFAGMYYIANAIYKKAERNKVAQFEKKVNDPARKIAKMQTASIYNNASDLNEVIKRLQASKENLLESKNNIDTNVIPSIEHSLQAFESSATDLIKVPTKHQNNLNYYLSLYEVVDTEQANSLGDAIRIVEDRYQRAELNAELRAQIVASQKALETTIRQSADQIVGSIRQGFNTLHQDLQQINAQFTSVNKQVQSTNAQLVKLNTDVDGHLEAIRSLINAGQASNAMLISEMNNIQNVANDIAANTQRY